MSFSQKNKKYLNFQIFSLKIKKLVRFFSKITKFGGRVHASPRRVIIGGSPEGRAPHPPMMSKGCDKENNREL
jgi:hypothetical protein